MIEQLEALVALSAEGTMARVATRLRVEPSTVSKRLAALEARLGRRLLEPRGRKVALTPEGARLAAQAGPLLAELRAALQGGEGAGPARVRVGVSESVLSSWGARLLAAARRAAPGLELELHAHRSPVVLERVRAGEYAVGLCATSPAAVPDLAARVLIREPVVLVPAGGRRLPRARPLPVLAIEAHAATWDSLAGRLDELGLEVAARVESFACAVQMARAGLGHALVPLGIARALGVPGRQLVRLGRPRLVRPVCLVARATTLARPGLGALAARLEDEAQGVQRRLGS